MTTPGRMDHIAVLEQYRDAWIAGDFAALIDLYHNDFRLHWHGENSLAGVHEGKAAAVSALLEFTRRTNRQRADVTHVMADEERGVMIAREHLTGGDETREVERLLVYRTDGRKILECWVYDGEQAFIDRLLNA